jgi:hypothetical protein
MIIFVCNFFKLEKNLVNQIVEIGLVFELGDILFRMRIYLSEFTVLTTLIIIIIG